MTPITQEQIRETLDRLRAYAYHFYYGPEARESLTKHIIRHDGRQFAISLRDDGNYEINTVDGKTKIVYEARVITQSPRVSTTFDNLTYQAVVLNVADLSETDLKWAHEVDIFVLSTLQRANAFIFLACSHDTTLDRMAEDLSKMSPAT